VVIAALAAAPSIPVLPFWLGVTILGLCIGATLQFGVDRLQLAKKVNTTTYKGRIVSRILGNMPAIQQLSRRLLRVNSNRNWRNHVRLATYGLLGLTLVVAGQVGTRFIAASNLAAEKKIAEDSERLRLTTVANATVATLMSEAENALAENNFRAAQDKLDLAIKTPNATHFDRVRAMSTRLANMQVVVLLADATKALNAGDIGVGRQKVKDALAIPNADAFDDVRILNAQIHKATEPDRIREAMMELSDDSFQDLMDSGKIPEQMLSGYQVLDDCAAELATAKVDEVAEARRSHKLAQLEVQRKEQEEARIAAETAARKAEMERKRNEKAKLAAVDDSNSRDSQSIRRGGVGYIEVEGENTVWVSIDEKAMDELNTFSAARNEDAISQMMEMGRVLVCTKRTKVSVIDPGFFSTTIRIMEGKHSGMTGIVPNEFIHAKTHGSDTISGTASQTNEETRLGTGGADLQTMTATVRGSRLVDFVSPTNANKMQMLKVTLKNTGSTAIRVVDADITWRDESGNILGTHNYTIFAVSDSAPGIQPGKTWTNPKGEGFLLPIFTDDGAATKAKSVDVKITKLLEYAEI